MELLSQTVMRNTLLNLLNEGLRAVDGEQRVFDSLNNLSQKDLHLIAVGKCAMAMAGGAYRACGEKIVSSFIVTKDEAFDIALNQYPQVSFMTSSHPVPDERSLAAGDALLQYIASTPPRANMLLLISGGTSSLVEVLPDGVTLKDIQKLNQWLLAHHYSIHEINAVRKQLSLIKGGGLLHYLGARHCDVKLISDVPGDVVASIGSGWCFPAPVEFDVPQGLPDWIHQLLATQSGVKQAVSSSIHSETIASNKMAREAIADEVKRLGLAVYHHEPIVTGNVEAVACEFTEQLLQGDPGVYIWGGETTVSLPKNPGRGGRNQHLALLVAQGLQGYENIVFLSVGSDANDGCTEDAGAIVDGRTIQRGGEAGLVVNDYIQRADAGTYLEQTEDLIHLGATGTNVMDLMLAIKVS